MEAFCEMEDAANAFCKVGDGRKAAGGGEKLLGDGTKGLCELRDGRKASGDGRRALSDEEKLFSEVGDGEKLFCEVGDGGNALCELGGGEIQGWVSPRISFSRNFTMAEGDTLSDSNSNSSSSRVFSEKRKWEQQDDYSSDFEFLKNDPSYGASDQAKGFMLSADELFSDGKLLPLPFPKNWVASDDLCLPWTSEHHHQQVKLSLQKSPNHRPMARHLSFEISKPCFSFCPPFTTPHLSFETFSCISSPSWVSPCDPSPSTAPASPTAFPSSLSSSLPASSLPPPSSSSSSSALPSSSSSSSSSSSTSSSKYSTKFKDFFKFKRVSMGLSPSQLTSRNNSITSTCRLPISPRSFWPFSRSNSAGESKTTTPPPLPCRSNSAGESNTSRTSFVSKRSDSLEAARQCSTSTIQPFKMQGPMASIHEESPHLTPIEDASAEGTSKSLKHLDHSTSNAVGVFQDATESTVMNRSITVGGSRIFSEVSKKKAISAASNFARGSPGRRGGASSSPGVKVNAGKIVLKNLERCSAEKKLGRDVWNGLNTRGSYPAAVRVSPVLNVAIYRGGNTPKIGLFRFGSLFSLKKEKKPMEAAINWRKGA